MRELQYILKGLKVRSTTGNVPPTCAGLAFDSRKVKANDIFIAVCGTQADGHDFIEKAIQMGANTIVCEKIPIKTFPNVAYIQVEDSAFALGIMASNYYEHPSHQLKLVGVTGTNGKTTIASLLFQLFTSLGYACGLLSTIENKIGIKIIPSTHTTPDPIQLNRLLREMLDEGVEYAFMEVSSHAIDQHRIAGLHFTGGIFTNITHDHLDYHKTFENYISAKKKFFDDLDKKAFALSNIDDRNGAIMLQNTQAAKHTYALKKPADFKATIIENSFEGLYMRLQQKEFYAKLTGTFNAYNLLAIFGAAVLLGEEEQEVLQAMSLLDPAEGRFEIIKSADNITAIVDYAHTPDALENVLKTISQIRTHQEQLIVVVGAGGDRDKTKRPKMAKAAASYADLLILTSDNPRSEAPEQIIQDMMQGINAEIEHKVLNITSREMAIKTATMSAKSGDIILIAGKGHEKYQEIKGVKHPFDDKKIIADLLNKN